MNQDKLKRIVSEVADQWLQVNNPDKSSPLRSLASITAQLRAANDKLETTVERLDKVLDNAARISAHGWPAVRR